MIIDSHAHIGAMPGLFAGNAEEVLAHGDRLGFDKMFISHVGGLKYDFHEANRELAADIRRHPDRILGYVAIPTAYFGQEAIDELLRGVEMYGMRGLKIYSQPAAGGYQTLYSIDSPGHYPLIEKAAELRCPILAHATPQEIDRVASIVPEALLIMAHAGGMPPAYGDWQRALAVAREHPNVYLDTTSSMVDAGYIEAFVAGVGPERVLFGTDIPLLDPATQLSKVTDAEIDDAAKRLILGGNMTRLLEAR